MKSLHARIATVMLLLFTAYGSLQLVVSLFVARSLVDEVQQTANLDLARHFVGTRPLMKDHQVNQGVATALFEMVTAANPTAELYVLDPNGRVLASSPSPGALVRDQVSIGPLQQLLSGAARPVFADDPRQAEGQKIFSVASLPDGFLYVVLKGQHFDSIFNMMLSSRILKWGAWMALLTLAFAFGKGFLLSRYLTRRLRVLAANMDTFERSSVTAGTSGIGVVPVQDRDEIERLAIIFEGMRARIADQFARLRDVDAERRELVTNVSHDLRTPLAALQGSLETLSSLREQRAADEQRYLETAVRQSHRLTGLVDQLFELARLDDGAKMGLTIEPFSLVELVQDVADKLRVLFERKPVTLRVSLDRRLPAVRGDIAWIERALENVLDNALRHTPEHGTVTISCTDDGGGTRVTIADTGPGIARADLPHIFERAFRGNGKETSGRSTRAGLGLAIASRVMELHGATLTVASEPQSGAAFSFTLLNVE